MTGLPVGGKAEARAALVAAVRRASALGLNRGSTGNCSLRWQGGMLITPTGMGPEAGVDDLVWCAEDGRVAGRWKPSSEWPFHAAIYRARPDLRAVVHVHSVHATALACLRRELPPFHYMVAVAGGASVPCVPYHVYGGDALAAAVAAAFADRDACLLANHGLVAGAATLERALAITVELEALCEVYLKACAAGTPALLDAAQMAEVIAKFGDYGQARSAQRSI